MFYVPEYFQPWELLPRDLYNKLKNAGWTHERMWQLLDSRTLVVGDKIRERYGKMVANTWYYGGEHQFRGFRPRWCAVGAEYSQHRAGRAQDLLPADVAAEEIRQDIILGVNYDLITCIEAGVSWLHHDERNYDGLLIINP